MWYNETGLYTKNLLLSHSIGFLIFSQQSRGSDRVKSTKCETSWCGMKNAIMQVTYVLNGCIVNLLFCCQIIIY